MKLKKTTTPKAPEVLPEEIRGSSVFAVETIAHGIKVQTVFLTEDGKILQLPAVFPNQEYALTQINELRAAVIKHFSEAASIGAKLIANAKQMSAGPDDTIKNEIAGH